MRPFQFINGPWEYSELPTIVRESPEGGDPHILAALKRIHNPDALYELCRLANDQVERSASPTPQTTPTRDETVLTGWKLVPIEPTPEMMDAAIAVVEKPCFPQDIYAAMLASAPAPASGAGQNEKGPAVMAGPLRDHDPAATAATPVSEAGGEIELTIRYLRCADDDLASAGVKLIGTRFANVRGVIRDAIAVLERSAIAKPASSPAGGDVRVVDWITVAKAAGTHGVRYRTNRALEAFLTEITAALSKGDANG